ncbi:hypothetical protein SEA_WOFFORD_127 [Streptomyces phage Wofford]|uniref:Uncharacterized protein n=1 Tax=Streptomyces phage Wofford TaxID=2283267 RepID=A0A345M9X7_9CAUD|nr:hypothetical protein HWB78_gp157 [Streptomyces phage Wollford]AXH67298.1 hypothetical protein SEA_WOFFORD_127 [Streptomyces phage Wollford]
MTEHKYETRTYRFEGTHKLADEVAHLAITNDCRVSTRTASGMLRKKKHLFVVFGAVARLERFETQMEKAKGRIQ